MFATGEGNTSNPLKQVLNAVGEQVECAIYDRVSKGDYMHVITLSLTSVVTQVLVLAA